MALKLFNTLSRNIVEFGPLESSKIGLNICGTTFYDYTYNGYLIKYVVNDLIKKVLYANGFEVQHVMNITDVGHLTGEDDDTGDDKLEKGAKERNLTVWETAKYFTDYFFDSTSQVNIERADEVPKATDHIGEQVKLIQKLEQNGFTYVT